MKNSLITAIILSATLITNCFSQNVGWEGVQSNTGFNLNSSFLFDHQFGFACGDSGVVLKSIDSGKTWQSLLSPVVFNLYDCFMFEQDCVFAVGDSASGISSYNYGSTWYVFSLISGLDKPFYSIDFINDQGIFNGILGGGLQTILFGASISCATVIVNDYLSYEEGGFYSACMITPVMGVVAGENAISEPIIGKTTDLGNDWEIIPIDLNGYKGKALGVSFTDQMNGFISAKVLGGQGAIAKTTDFGNNWTTTFFNNPLSSINFPISGTSQVGYCVGDSGVILKTSNAGENWYNQISPTSEKLNKVYFVDQNFGFAVGDNGTILRTTDGGGITSITEDEVSGVLNFELQQNYPNPFNPTTTLSFVIGHLSFVSIKVYDMLGNEIAALVNEEKPAGSYEVEFDGTDLPSGIYFSQLKCGSFRQTKKMLLLK